MTTLLRPQPVLTCPVLDATQGPRPGDRVVSCRQPWLWLLLSGLKPIENRTWATSYRGPLWLHAGVTVADLGRENWSAELGQLTPDVGTLPLGAIVGRVELVDCLEVTELPEELAGHWSAGGPICWVVRNPARLAEPVPLKGKLRVWRL